MSSIVGYCLRERARGRTLRAIDQPRTVSTGARLQMYQCTTCGGRVGRFLKGGRTRGRTRGTLNKFIKGRRNPARRVVRGSGFDDYDYPEYETDYGGGYFY